LIIQLHRVAESRGDGAILAIGDSQHVYIKKELYGSRSGDLSLKFS
jgi:hypothetical protein